jgi:hypothetical protein
MARRSAWPVEMILLMSVLSIPFGILDLLFYPLTPIQLIGRCIWVLAYGFIGVGIALLGPAPASSSPA